jgi:hypothetical protein
MGRPGVRNFEIPDDIFLPAKAVADARGEKLTHVVRAALRGYALLHASDLKTPPPARQGALPAGPR